MKYVNNSNSTLLIGKKDFYAGDEVPYSKDKPEKYLRDFNRFLELGFIKKKEEPKKQAASKKTESSSKKTYSHKKEEETVKPNVEVKPQEETQKDTDNALRPENQEQKQ